MEKILGLIVTKEVTFSKKTGANKGSYKTKTNKKKQKSFITINTVKICSNDNINNNIFPTHVFSVCDPLYKKKK